MANFRIRSFMIFNTFLIRLSRGRLGSKLGPQDILILHTVGRRTGSDRLTPIAYFEHEGRYLIVGSNWGLEKQADWYWNLIDQPRAVLEVGGRIIPTRSHEAQGQEYDRLWDYVTGIYPHYLDFQKMTSRHIPIMVFEPMR